MSTRLHAWPAGTPCWTDLNPADPAAARAFYAAVLGWSWDEPQEQFGGYANARLHGETVAGMMAGTPAAPTAWTLYFASDDLDATAAAITDHGGTLLAAPMDVADLGRMAIAQDPTGAMFGVWQAGTHTGTRVLNEPGCLAWEDLRSTDPDAARAFFAAVFDLEMRPVEMAGPDYTTAHLAGSDAPLGGIGGMMGDPGDSHWLVYFAVSDIDAALREAVAHGGAVAVGAFDTPYGQMASITDPGGAALWLVVPTMAAPER